MSSSWWDGLRAAIPHIVEGAATTGTALVGALGDVQHGSESWQCLCRATNFGMRAVPQGNVTDASVAKASLRVVANIQESGLRFCAHGEVYNPSANLDSGSRGTCSPHFPIFKLFPPVKHGTVVPEATLKELSTRFRGHQGNERYARLADKFTQEWLGNVRRWHWDCVPTTYRQPYVYYSPMRLVDCIRGVPDKGADLPIVDEEYFELADGLMAVAAAKPGGKFIVAELGARYAPWALRAMVAARSLGRSREFYGIVVDPKKEHVQWTHEHFLMNGFNTSQYRVIHGMAFRGDKLLPKALASKDVHHLSEILKDVDHVDLLDVDVQNAEKYILRVRKDREALEQKVMRAHIEVHTVETARIVLGILKKSGFRILRNATSNMVWTYEHEQLGKVMFRSGYVYASNTRFEETLNGAC